MNKDLVIGIRPGDFEDSRIAGEDIASDQAPALCDPELCRNVADVGLRHLGQAIET